MIDKEEAGKLVDKFSLVFQPIMKLFSETESELYAYEILLHCREKDCFPKYEFNRLIQNEDTNRILMEWYEKELIVYLRRYPEFLFELNIHPQQLKCASTWRFLESMQIFNKRLIIELTEHPPVFLHYKDSVEYNLSHCMKQIVKLGYEIVIDDVSSGQNTLDLVIENIDSISGFKFSMLNFRDLDFDTMMSFLEVWLKFSKKYHLGFIVEGVENKEIMQYLYRKEVILQQGYYWSPGRKL